MKKFECLGKILSKNDQKRIIGGEVDPDGGGTCCWHTAGWYIYECELTREEAQTTASLYAQSSGEHAYWCCASC